MVRIRAFKGLHFNTEKVDLSDVVTQPYDKISPDLLEKYYQRSEYTTAKLIKNNSYAKIFVQSMNKAGYVCLWLLDKFLFYLLEKLLASPR